MNQCTYCQQEFSNPGGLGAHHPYCKSNPNRVNRTRPPGAGRKKGKDYFVWNRGKTGLQTAWNKGVKGTTLGKGLTEEKELARKEKISQKARASAHRRLVKSVRNYTKKDGSVVMLDSSWEEALAMRLDELDINWLRPDPMKWVDADGLDHNYFPDFYLPDFDIYLDPKNPQAFRVQKHKIDCLQEQIPNLVFLTSLADCKNYKP